MVIDAQRAVESLNGRLLCRQALDVRQATAGGRAPGGGPMQQAGGVGDPSPSPNLYIKGLPPGTTDVGLRNVFAPFGAILDSRILYPESSSPSALLRYTSIQEATAAIAAMHGVTPPGAVNMLQVRFAESAADKARRAAQLGAARPGPPGPGPMTGPGVSRVGTVHLPAGVEAVDKLECPPTLVGWLIGRSGETIKSLQLRSGCVISIDQTMGEGQPRVVNIAGTREQVVLGRQLVEELLVSGAARSGGSWAPPGGQGGPPPSYGGGGGDQYHHQHRGPPPMPMPPPQSAMAPPPPLALPAPRVAEPEEPDPCVLTCRLFPCVTVTHAQLRLTGRRLCTTRTRGMQPSRRPRSAKSSCPRRCGRRWWMPPCSTPQPCGKRSAWRQAACCSLRPLRGTSCACVTTASVVS